MPKSTPPAEAPVPTEPTKLSIYEALPLITADVRAVGKNNKNEDQGYAFRGIDDVVQMIHSLLPKYGVGLIPKVTKVTQENVTSARGAKGWHSIVEMDYKMTARDGTQEIGSGIGESTAYDDKGIAKAQSMAFKYFLVQAFTIPTNEMLDTENDPAGDEPMVPETDPFIPGAQSAHTPLPAARPNGEGRSGPKPPGVSTGLADSKITGLHKQNEAPKADPPIFEPPKKNEAGEIIGVDQWALDEVRRLPAISGKPLGEATPTQLQQIVTMGDEYIAHGRSKGKEEIAVRAVEGARKLLASLAPVEEDDLS
jgi:hypothetical protein